MLAALLISLIPVQQADVALRPRAIVAEDGRLVEGKVVVVRGEQIHALMDAPPAGARIVDLDGVLAPGMVDAFSRAGAAGRIGEDAHALAPGLRAADGADLDQKNWEDLAARGVTTVHLVPEPSNVLAGFGALLATEGLKRQVAETTVQVVSLTGWTYDERVGPTALAGCLELLEQGLADAGPAATRAGLLVFVENAEGIRGARALFERAGISQRHFVLFGDPGTYAGEAAGELVCLPAIGAGGARAREAEVLERLHAAGTRVAYGTLNGEGGHDALRHAAMLHARATGDPGAAWAAVTRNAAEVLGLGDRIGHIAAGARADLVLWTGHPLDAAARVQAVMIGGQTVFAAAPQER